MVRGGQLGREVAGGLSESAAMARLGEVAGIATASFPQTYAAEKQALRDVGVKGAWNKPIAAITAAVSGVIESIVPNPFKGGKVTPGGGSLRAAREYISGFAKRLPSQVQLPCRAHVIQASYW